MKLGPASNCKVASTPITNQPQQSPPSTTLDHIRACGGGPASLNIKRGTLKRTEKGSVLPTNLEWVNAYKGSACMKQRLCFSYYSSCFSLPIPPPSLHTHHPNFARPPRTHQCPRCSPTLPTKLPPCSQHCEPKIGTRRPCCNKSCHANIFAIAYLARKLLSKPASLTSSHRV